MAVYGVVPDEPRQIEEAIRRACAENDIVVLNAGSSKGSDDWCMEVLERIGKVLYHETNHGPGHHSSGSVVDGTPVVGISVPPRGAAFTMDFYLRPVVQRFLAQPTEAPSVLARLASKLPAKHHGHGGHAPAGERRPNLAHPDEVFYTVVYMRLAASDRGELLATPVGAGAGDVQAENTQGYYLMPSYAGAEMPEVGDLVHVQLRAARL